MTLYIDTVSNTGLVDINNNVSGNHGIKHINLGMLYIAEH